MTHHVGHVVEARVLPVGGAVVGEQPVSVGIRKTSRSGLRPPTPRRAPPPGDRKLIRSGKRKLSKTYVENMVNMMRGLCDPDLRWESVGVWGVSACRMQSMWSWAEL